MRKKYAAILLGGVLAALLLGGCKEKEAETAAVGENGNAQETAKEETEEAAVPEKLTLWYTQPDLEAYFAEAAAAYEAQTGTNVEIRQTAALDYIETIHDGSVKDTDYPDLYVATPDMLEKAKLTGLTLETSEDGCSAANFPQKALDAVTYKGERIAYPFYSDTSVLVYNRNYVQEPPATVEDIQVFSETFEGDGSVQNVFMWNVNDIFVDFFTIGFYVDLGGVHGDSLDQIVLNSEEIRECLAFYQSLNQFFAIDKEAVSEEQIVQDFAEGKTVYAIIRDDSIAKLDEKIARLAAEAGEGAAPVSYGIAQVPDLTQTLQVRPLSITHSIVVNGYTREPEAAMELAEFLTVGYADRLYGSTGNFPVKKGMTYEHADMEQVTAQYAEAVEVPKVMQMSNYWLVMEPAFADIWTGADVAARMETAEAAMREALGHQDGS